MISRIIPGAVGAGVASLFEHQLAACSSALSERVRSHAAASTSGVPHAGAVLFATARWRRFLGSPAGARAASSTPKQQQHQEQPRAAAGGGAEARDAARGFVQGGFRVADFPPERIRNFSIVVRGGMALRLPCMHACMQICMLRLHARMFGVPACMGARSRSSCVPRCGGAPLLCCLLCAQLGGAWQDGTAAPARPRVGTQKRPADTARHRIPAEAAAWRLPSEPPAPLPGPPSGTH